MVYTKYFLGYFVNKKRCTEFLENSQPFQHVRAQANNSFVTFLENTQNMASPARQEKGPTPLVYLHNRGCKWANTRISQKARGRTQDQKFWNSTLRGLSSEFTQEPHKIHFVGKQFSFWRKNKGAYQHRSRALQQAGSTLCTLTF